MSRLSDLTSQLLDAAKKAGADAADAIATDGVSQSIDVLGGKLEHAERSEGVEIGLRVLTGQRQACVSASDTKPETIAEMAERAVAMAKIAPQDPHIGLADPSQITGDTSASDLALVEDAPEPSPADLEDRALRAEAAALAVEGVSKADSASAGHSRT
ncbi:MAG: DNA gyrase modulator, partial [Pseudomonadota bacterium]